MFTGLVTPDRVQRWRPSEERSTASCGPSWPRPTCSGCPFPRPIGGGGYGMVEVALVLEAQGRSVAPVPLWATVVLGAMPVAEFGSDDAEGRSADRGRLRPAPCSTAALADVAGDIAARRPGPARDRAAGGGRVACRCPARPLPCPSAHVADRVLVPALPRRRHDRRRDRSEGRRGDGRAGRHHQPGDPSPPPPGRGGASGPTICWPAVILTAGPRC